MREIGKEIDVKELRVFDVIQFEDFHLHSYCGQCMVYAITPNKIYFIDKINSEEISVSNFLTKTKLPNMKLVGQMNFSEKILSDTKIYQ